MFNEIAFFTTAWFVTYRLIEETYIFLYNKKFLKRIRNLEIFSSDIVYAIYINTLGISSLLYEDIIVPISFSYLIFMTFIYFGVYSIYLLYYYPYYPFYF